MTSASPAVEIAEARFAYDARGPAVLDIPEFHIAPGERVFLRGPSGSGKSTLLGLIAGILTPQVGAVKVLGEPMSSLPGAKRDALRAARIGVIFQMFNLLPYLSAGENIAAPCRFSNQRRAEAEKAGGVRVESRRLMERLGLAADAYWRAKPGRLSVGQQQRVAAARALIGRPGLILADEPTSALDADARDAFISLLIEECEAAGAALLFVSHDAALAQHFDRAEDLSAINGAPA